MHCFDPRDQLLGLKVEEQPKSWHTVWEAAGPQHSSPAGSPSLWAGGAVQCGHVGQAAQDWGGGGIEYASGLWIQEVLM